VLQEIREESNKHNDERRLSHHSRGLLSEGLGDGDSRGLYLESSFSSSSHCVRTGVRLQRSWVDSTVRSRDSTVANSVQNLLENLTASSVNETENNRVGLTTSEGDINGNGWVRGGEIVDPAPIGLEKIVNSNIKGSNGISGIRRPGLEDIVPVNGNSTVVATNLLNSFADSASTRGKTAETVGNRGGSRRGWAATIVKPCGVMELVSTKTSQLKGFLGSSCELGGRNSSTTSGVGSNNGRRTRAGGGSGVDTPCNHTFWDFRLGGRASGQKGELSCRT